MVDMLLINVERAIEMLGFAADYITQHCPDQEIFYDGTECDGYCLAQDCAALIYELRQAIPAPVGEAAEAAHEKQP